MKVLHVVPALNIGGVEVGIYRSRSELAAQLDFHVFSVKGGGALPIPRIGIRELLSWFFRRQHRPEVIVSSLWLGHLVGAVLAVIFHAKWIPFFHAARSEGALRDFVLRGAARWSRLAFFDSLATQNYYGNIIGSQAVVVPYRFRMEAAHLKSPVGRLYDCIFVGRLSPEKRPDLLLLYLKSLHRLNAELKSLLILATDPISAEKFTALLYEQGIKAEIRINVEPMEVVVLLAQSALYLSFSDYEGFSMATVDAMSSGCVPVARPVGEIPSYVDDRCGILIPDPSPGGIEAAARESLVLLSDPERLSLFSGRAQQSVERYELYTDAYLSGLSLAVEPA